MGECNTVYSGCAYRIDGTLFFCNPQSGRFVLLCDYIFFQKRCTAAAAASATALGIFTVFISNAAALPCLYVNKHTNTKLEFTPVICLWPFHGVYVHMKELQSISSHQMNIISLSLPKLERADVFTNIFRLRYLLLHFILFSFVVEIVFHYLSDNAAVNENENEFFGFGGVDFVSVAQRRKIYNWLQTNNKSTAKNWVNGALHLVAS